jgi:hypothetical protein
MPQVAKSKQAKCFCTKAKERSASIEANKMVRVVVYSYELYWLEGIFVLYLQLETCFTLQLLTDVPKALGPSVAKSAKLCLLVCPFNDSLLSTSCVPSKNPNRAWVVAQTATNLKTPPTTNLRKTFHAQGHAA